MFKGCSNLKTIIVGNDFNCSNAVGVQMFTGCTSLVGGAGTAYDANHTTFEYTHIDGGDIEPGIFHITSTI